MFSRIYAFSDILEFIKRLKNFSNNKFIWKKVCDFA